MVAQIVVTLAVILVLLTPLAASADSRDGRDWQPRDAWTGRRGDPHS